MLLSIYRMPRAIEILNDKQSEIMQALARRAGMTPYAIAKDGDLALLSVQSYIPRLERYGFLRETDSMKWRTGKRKREYALTFPGLVLAVSAFGDLDRLDRVPSSLDAYCDAVDYLPFRYHKNLLNWPIHKTSIVPVERQATGIKSEVERWLVSSRSTLGARLYEHFHLAARFVSESIRTSMQIAYTSIGEKRIERLWGPPSRREDAWKNAYTKAFLQSLQNERLKPFHQMPHPVRQVLMTSANSLFEDAQRQQYAAQQLKKAVQAS